MKKLTGNEIVTWLLSAHEVEVLQDAADQKEEFKNILYLDFDESMLLIEDCDGAFLMCIFEPGKGIERAFTLLHYPVVFKVRCIVGKLEYVGNNTMEAEFTGLLHETWEGAERELHEAESHEAVRCAWIEMI